MRTSVDQGQKEVTAIYEKPYPVHSYEADHRGLARAVSLLNFLQDAAGDHAELLGISVAQLQRRNLTWLLTRYRALFRRYPCHGETLRVRTWPSSREGLQALREFEIVDASGEPVVQATSAWIVVNLETRRPVRLNENLPAYPVTCRRALADGFAPLPSVGRADLELPFRVRLADLDLNRHVNNTVYIEWALETVPREVLEEWHPAEIEVAYRAEAFYPDRVLARTGAPDVGEGSTFVHQLASERSGKELTRLRTRWERTLVA